MLYKIHTKALVTKGLLIKKKLTI